VNNKEYKESKLHQEKSCQENLITKQNDNQNSFYQLPSLFVQLIDTRFDLIFDTI
jgi:hypothetical protein